MLRYSRLTLARQFLLVSSLILLTGMVVIGLWVGRQIETGVINRTAGVTALYVDSFIAPHVQSLANGGRLDKEQFRALASLLTETPLGQRIVAFKIWGRDGHVIYSTNPTLIGRQFPTGRTSDVLTYKRHSGVELSDPLLNATYFRHLLSLFGLRGRFQQSPFPGACRLSSVRISDPPVFRDRHRVRFPGSRKCLE